MKEEQRLTLHKINKKYKDRLFRLIFQDKKDLLELYNAINNSDYTNPLYKKMWLLLVTFFIKSSYLQNHIHVDNQLNLSDHAFLVKPSPY